MFFPIRVGLVRLEGISVFKIDFERALETDSETDLTMACQLPKLSVAFPNFMHLIQKP